MKDNSSYSSTTEFDIEARLKRAEEQSKFRLCHGQALRQPSSVTVGKGHA